MTPEQELKVCQWLGRRTKDELFFVIENASRRFNSLRMQEKLAAKELKRKQKQSQG